jgi:hypothetical protein
VYTLSALWYLDKLASDYLGITSGHQVSLYYISRKRRRGEQGQHLVLVTCKKTLWAGVNGGERARDATEKLSCI